MPTIAEKLLQLHAAKKALDEVMISQGRPVGGLASYANRIAELGVIPQPIPPVVAEPDPAPAMWTRPSDWLALPTVSASEQKIVALYAVRPNNAQNYVAVKMSGPYTVDWGDGSAPVNYSSAATATKQYDYATPALASTLTADGYRQAIITITPQSGQNLTSVDFSVKHPSNATGASLGYLDVAMSVPNASTLRWATTTPGTYTAASTLTNTYDLLQRVNLVNIKGTTILAGLFYKCTSLRRLETLNIATGLYRELSTTFNASTFTTSAAHGLAGNTGAIIAQHALSTGGPYLSSTSTGLDYGGTVASVPTTTTLTLRSYQSGTTFTFGTGVTGTATVCAGVVADDMFYNCDLDSVPFFDATSLIAATRMFCLNANLLSVANLDLSNCRQISNMFSSCANLATLANVTMGVVTSAFAAFSSCTKLAALPPGLDVRSSRRTGGMYSGCRALTSIPANAAAPNTSIDIAQMFASCVSLTSVPAINAPYAASAANCFSGCSSLTSATATLPVATTLASMFAQCTSLTSLPTISAAAATTTASMFSGCTGLTALNGNLSLPNVNTATSMFDSCSGLTSVGTEVNLPKLAVAQGMFANCTNLVSVNNFPMSAVAKTAVTNMFANCTSLTAVTLDMSAVTASGAAPFTNCRSLKSLILNGLTMGMTLTQLGMEDGSDLNALYASLGTPASARTLLVSGNWGVIDHNPSIATAKNWTITT